MHAEMSGEMVAHYHHQRGGGAAFRFVIDAATEVCSDAFSDGSNKFPHGTLWTLLRTARGRYVWAVESQWIGEPRVRFVAVESPGGKFHRHDIDHVDRFIKHHGDDLDLINWRDHIGVPLEKV